MKKIIIFTALVATLLFAFTPSVYAKQETLKLPSWFNQVFQPVQNTLKSLATRIENLEKKVAELEKAVADLGKKKVDFDLPNQWSVSFYEDRFTLNTPPTDSPPSPPGTISLPLPPLPYPLDNNCRWNNAVIDSDASARAIAHLNTGDIYGAGSCRGITFRTSNIPPSGTTFETDIYVWWQGTEKHTKQTVIVPNRPFPPINPPFTNPNSGGMLITPSGPVGIGPTNPTVQVDLNRPSNYQELLHIP